MSIQNYIGWPIGVNKVILDSTTISIGDGAVRTDELENGHKQSELKSAYVPEKYPIKMTFNWVKPVGNTGKTEYQLFTEWYKYKHKCGVIPFEFPKILYSSNTGVMIYDAPTASVQYTEYYKITSVTEGSKSGEDVSVSMTWETVYGGTVSIPTPEPEVNGISAHSNYLDVFFSEVSDTAPTSSHISVYRKTTGSYSQVTVTGFVFDGTSTARLYYDEFESGTFSIAIDDYSGYSETVGTHESTLE